MLRFRQTEDFRDIVSWAVLVFLISVIIHSPTSIPNYYSDFNAFWSRPEIRAMKRPYFDFVFEYPPLSGIIVYVAQNASQMNNVLYWYLSYAASVALFLALMLVCTVKLCRMKGSNPTRVITWVLATPSMIWFGVYNFDVMAAALVVLAVLLMLENRPNASGIALAFAVVAKLYPLTLLPIFLQKIGDKKGIGKFLFSFATTIAAFHLPIFLNNAQLWWDNVSVATKGGMENSWLVFFFDRPELFQWGRAVSVLLMVFGLGRVLLSKYDFVEKVFLMTGVFLFSSWVYTPQMNIWLLPFFAVINVTSLPIFLAFDLLNTSIILFFFQFTNQFGPQSPIQLIALSRTLLLLSFIMKFLYPEFFRTLIEPLKVDR